MECEMEIKKYLVVMIMMLAATTADASTVTIDYEVTGLDSLYYTDWGHAYNITGAGNQYDALGRGVAAGHVGYAFVAGQQLDVSAWSCVRDAGTRCTGADGYNWLFRGLNVYSLIGIWSESETEIEAVGNAFVLGSSVSLVTPQSTGPLYLFLGENDGIFADNFARDYYHVAITTPAVPVPAAAWLFSSGLLGLLGVAKRRQKN